MQIGISISLFARLEVYGPNDLHLVDNRQQVHDTFDSIQDHTVECLTDPIQVRIVFDKVCLEHSKFRLFIRLTYAYIDRVCKTLPMRGDQAAIKTQLDTLLNGLIESCIAPALFRKHL
ncbi:hypothetical protein D3C80_1788580 [compost metagenome]